MTEANRNITTRPWGSFEVLHRYVDYVIKRLNIRKQQETSLQYHESRDETVVVVYGTLKVVVDDVEHVLYSGDSVKIKAKQRHRLVNIGMCSCNIVEVWTGFKFDEDDIVRIEDRYGREVQSI